MLDSRLWCGSLFYHAMGVSRVMSPLRVAALVRKEILHIIRDPRNLFLVTISPAFLLFLLSYVFSFEVTKLNLAALDLDRSPASRSYLSSLTNDQELVLTSVIESYQEILPLLVSGDADAVLIIPPGFADTVHGGGPSQVQAIIDGTDPFLSSQAIGALGARSGVFVAGIDGNGLMEIVEPIEVRSQAWYNASLESMHSMVPGLLAIVLIMPTMAFALAMTREKETGTLEGLIVTPVSGPEYVAGKLLAYITAGLVSAILAMLVAVLWFKVPFRGNLVAYLVLVADYFLACMGITVVVASFVKSQQAGMFIVLLLFLVPSFFLGGLITPVSTNSLGSILTSYALPSTHFIEISRTVFLKGLGLAHLTRPALLLFGVGVGSIALGLRLFRKKLA
jgi:ABC-2 type transport system permease protein